MSYQNLRQLKRQPPNLNIKADITYDEFAEFQISIFILNLLYLFRKCAIFILKLPSR